MVSLIIIVISIFFFFLIYLFFSSSYLFFFFLSKPRFRTRRTRGSDRSRRAISAGSEWKLRGQVEEDRNESSHSCRFRVRIDQRVFPTPRRRPHSEPQVGSLLSLLLRVSARYLLGKKISTGKKNRSLFCTTHKKTHAQHTVAFYGHVTTGVGRCNVRSNDTVTVVVTTRRVKQLTFVRFPVLRVQLCCVTTNR